MSAVVQIASNAIVAKVYNADRDTKLAISTLLSYQVAGAEHTERFKGGGWDGRSSFFDFRAGTFPAGFVDYVRHHLTTKMGLTVQLVRKPFPVPLGPEKPKIDAFGDDPNYDYQPETVRRLLKYGRMIAQVATGGGKSRIARLVYARIQRPTLFLTTRGVLMHQMKEAFEEGGVPVGVLGDSEWRPKRGMNVGMVQTLVARLQRFDSKVEIERMIARNTENQAKALKADDKTWQPMSIEQIKATVKKKAEEHEVRRQRTAKLMELFEVVIGEEAHEAGGNSYYEIMRHCKNAHYRLALTATPFMRDDAEDNMRLMAAFGMVGIKVSEELLIERGILAKPCFKHYATDKPAKLYRTTPWQRAYTYGIVENAGRNAIVISEAVRAAKYGLPAMVLVQHKKHGELLKKSMQAAGLRVEFIYGDHKQAERKAALKKLGAGSMNVLIGSTILDVGVDVPAVGVVILAGGGKAEVALRQRIGRGLRRKKTGPNVAFIVDFLDEHNSHLATHARQRLEIIKGTPGFAENVLGPGEDFDFSGFKLVA